MAELKDDIERKPDHLCSLGLAQDKLNSQNTLVHDLKPKRVIVWRITQHCNLGCRFCSYSREQERLRDTADPAQVERFGRTLSRYAAQQKQKVLISWIGGEPFLWPALLDLSRTFVRDLGLEISATTNGMPLRSAKIRERVVKDFSELVVSLDGIGAATDGPRQKPGLFDELKQSLSTLAELKHIKGKPLVLKVNTILMRHNIESFEQFCETLLNCGVQELTFNQLGGYDRPEFYPANRLLPDQVLHFAEALPGLRTAFQKKGLLIHGSDAYLHRFKCSSIDQKIPVQDCSPGSWFWFINENGLISPCSYTTYEYAVNIATLSDTPAIDAVEQRFRHMRTQARSKFCDDCHCTQLYDKFQ